MAAVNKNDYGTKSPLEKEERKNIVKIVTRIYIQKSNADFVEEMIKDYYYKHLTDVHPQ